MVPRLSLVPRIMGSHDGTLGVRLPPDVDTTPPLYRNLFWIDCLDAVFQPWCKHNLLLEEPLATLLTCCLQLQSLILTFISSLIQLACLIWYLVSYFPMGSSSLRVATTFGAQRAAAWMTG
jgi:hypothetical protein